MYAKQECNSYLLKRRIFEVSVNSYYTLAHCARVESDTVIFFAYCADAC